MNKPILRGASCVLALSLSFVTLAASSQAPARKDVLNIASRVADWQLARHGRDAAGHQFSEETANPRSWQQGAFWVGMTHFADVTR